MARSSLRQQFRDDPESTAAALAAYAAIGVVRPRWLTAASRRSPRRWLAVIVLRVVVLEFMRRAGRWLERLERLREELRAELGREPTVEEVAARAERNATDRS